MIIPEWTITELQEKMESGELTARRLAELDLQRISEIDKNGPYLNSVIELNPDALELADTLDAERKAGKTRGALHGVPILIKDNIDTQDRMQTLGINAGICAQNLSTWALSLRQTMLTILSSPAGSNLDLQIADSIKLSDQLMLGYDLNSDQTLELLPGECGATSVLDNVYRMADMPLLPISMTPTATELPGTQTQSSTPAPIRLTPTKGGGSGSQNTAVPPAATKPGNRDKPDNPKPTKKNP